jgi:hypothetical protein
MLDVVIPKIAASDRSPKYDVIVARKHNPQTSHNQGMLRFSYSTGKKRHRKGPVQVRNPLADPHMLLRRRC